jgi:hypothetical protein
MTELETILRGKDWPGVMGTLGEILDRCAKAALGLKSVRITFSGHSDDGLEAVVNFECDDQLTAEKLKLLLP